MNAVPPRDAHDPVLWERGYHLRCVHRPAAGSTECPICLRPWPCTPYRVALDAMYRASRPRAVGSATVPARRHCRWWRRHRT